MEDKKMLFENVNVLLGTGFLGTAITAWLTHMWTKRQMNANTDKVITETIRDLVTMAREEAEQQKIHRIKCEEEVEALKEKVKYLEANLCTQNCPKK